MQLQQLTVSSYIKGRFGEHGLRIWRLLIECPYLQMDQIERQALVGLREARTLIYSLFQRGYIRVQEVPKSAERTPTRTLYFYWTSVKVTYSQFLSDTYKGAGLLFCPSHDYVSTSVPCNMTGACA
jgi:DNA-directed RNA polymerase III subunit RPC3